jgi:peptidoglycan/LPS O-acetylase OafA/YrhL
MASNFSNVKAFLPKTALASTTIPTHFYLLDNLRGLAALAVVVGHWQHFFYKGTTAAEFVPERLPWAGALMPLYANGHRAVDLFFCLSGFIFYWLYSSQIAERRIGLKRFSALRFSRLYPLHLATLLLVAACQFFIHLRTGDYLIYPNNDATHFVTHLFFASNWIGGTASFNGPIWSVSVEILLYALFFFLCAFRLNRVWHLCLLALGGWLLKTHWIGGRGILEFFLGGIVFYAFNAIQKRSLGRSKDYAAMIACVLMWIAVPANYNWKLLEQLGSLCGSQIVLFAGETGQGLAHAVEHYTTKLTEDSFAVFLFPVTIFCFALLENRFACIGRKFSFLGDISYSSYLLHFPLQLGFIGIAFLCGLDMSWFSSPLTFVFFFILLIVLSLVSHNYFERPLQRYLRKKLNA